MMKPEFENIPLTKTENRFEIEFNGHSAFIDYREMGSQIALNHTEADLLISGTGAAVAVVEKTSSISEIIIGRHFLSARTLSHSLKKIPNGNVLSMKGFTDTINFKFH